MDMKHQLESEIELLSSEIEATPNQGLLYMERGKLYYKMGLFDKAMNDFICAKTIGNSSEAEQYISMIREIFEYRYTDQLNP